MFLLDFSPAVMAQVWGFASINRVYESIAEENVFWLTVLQKSFSSLQVRTRAAPTLPAWLTRIARVLRAQGLLNAFAYGMSDKIRQALVRDMPFLRRLCPGYDESLAQQPAPSAGLSPFPCAVIAVQVLQDRGK